MKESPFTGILSGKLKLLGVFIITLSILTVGVLIGRESDNLVNSFAFSSAAVPPNAGAFVSASSNWESLAAIEMVLLISILVTLLAGWTGYVLRKAFKARRELEEGRELLKTEMARQQGAFDELHITNQQLARTTGQLGGILEGTTDLIAAVDTSLKYISFNKAYSDNILTLFGREIRKGMDIRTALGSHPSKRDHSIRLWKRALQGEKFNAQQEFTIDDGTQLHYELSYTPIVDEQGNVTGAAQICRDVTERKRTEERLKQEMDFVSAAIDVNSSLVLVLDLEGRIIRFNQACEKLSGYKFEEIRGRIFWNILIPTEDVAKIKATYRDFDSSFFSADYVNHWITKDEEVKLISWQVSAIKDDSGNIKYIVGTGIDITEKREIETARNRMLMILENSPDLVAIYDFQGRIAYLNPAGRDLIGLDSDTDLNIVRMNNFQPSWVSELLQSEAIPTAVKSGSWLGTTALKTAAKKEIPASQLILAHQNLKGKVEYFSTVIRDISSQKTLEKNLAEARDDALEAIRNKSEFLANMSHEIRTPMSGIIGISELLLGTRLNEEQKDYAETIQKCGEALLTIINDILDFSKLEAGKLQLENTEIDLREMVDSVTELFTQTIYKKGLELSVLIGHDVPTRLIGDPGRIRQVLTNLVSNAVKFTEKGEIVVRVTLDKAGEVPLIRFAITDTGVGIAEDSRDSLFLPYSQTGPKTSREYGGTGLGLAICKQIVEMLDGEIGLESEIGRGSTFWFTAPLQLQDTDQETPELDVVRGRRILIVDDNDSNRRSLIHQVKAWEMVADEASTAEAAFGLLKSAARNREHFEIVVSDLEMPGLNGIGLAAKIKEEPILRRTSVVLMTSAAARSKIGDPEASGVHSVVTKPLRHKDLLRKMSRLLSDTSASSNENKASSESGWHSLTKIVDPATRDVRILIAEDNLVNRKVLLNQIRKIGFDATTVRNGAEAVRAFREKPFDIVLMDIEMPEMDGIEAAREIRSLQNGGPRTAIVAVTAHVLKGERDKCLAAGMDDYLGKPTRQSVLESSIRKWAKIVRSEAPFELDEPGDDSSLERERSDVRTITERIEELTEACGSEVVCECIDHFREDTERTVGRLERALEIEDFDLVASEAHKLRGSTANMGALDLSEICQKMLEGARRGDHLDCTELLDRFTDRYENLAGVYENLQANTGNSPAAIGDRS